jgi:hypothetical protein
MVASRAALLLGAALSFFDHEHLPATIRAAGRADMMDHVRRPAGIAFHEHRDVLEIIVAPPVSLAMPRDSLLW